MAWLLSDLIALMDRWKDWKDVKAAAEKVPQLEARIAALESRLSRTPGEACPKCGELTFRVESTRPDPTFGELGVSRRTMRCGECAFQEDRTAN